MAYQDIITREHFEFALDYTHKHGSKYRNNVLVLHRPHSPTGYCILHKGELYAPKEVVRVAHLRALEVRGELQQKREEHKEILKGKGLSPNFSWDNVDDVIELSWLWSYSSDDSPVRARKICKNNEHEAMLLSEAKKLQGKKENHMPNNSVNNGANEMDKYVKLLKQFKQVIFYGPPGTGKTYQAKATLKNMLGMENDSEFAKSQGKRWDIVQFHPSYNYEDFVRGVQVNTNDEGQVKYETKNRIFAEMCDKASRDEGNAYALIIDEINRANVSSVLGELIYALEYRGESVSTPYEIIGSRLLTIPPNLYIIGTMNTADRTIGALDYAVRRRFAFVHCPPDESLIEDAEAKSVFSKVKHIFADFLSPDFDAADVKIGHSYFMAAGEELHGKIQYQVIPILEEYVKDGVLLPEAKEKIKELLQEKRESEPPQPRPPRGQFRWTRDGRSGTNGVGRTVLSIIRDYVEHKDPQLSLEELQQAFPDHLAPGNRRTVASENDPDVLRDSSRYFMNHPIILLNGESTVVCREWGAPGIHWADFKNQVRYLGYTITGVE